MTRTSFLGEVVSFINSKIGQLLLRKFFLDRVFGGKVEYLGFVIGSNSIFDTFFTFSCEDNVGSSFSLTPFRIVGWGCFKLQISFSLRKKICAQRISYGIKYHGTLLCGCLH